MDDTIHHTFKLHLPGLLKVLAEHLYSNKQVAIRELIQNAHDSCRRRSVEDPAPEYQPRIHLSVDPDQATLCISDNGCGLTEDEIGQYLATIGRSYTGELRERLALLNADTSADLIGQFGFGFLSAFLIASDVTMITRSFRPGSPAICWRANGDERYEIGPGEHDEIGTSIVLRVKPTAAFVLQEGLLIDIVRRFADFLPDPIFVGNDPLPVNMMRAPWQAPQPEAAAQAYVLRAFDSQDPICVIPLHEHTIDLGHDSLALPLHGFLFVPPASPAVLREYGDLRVYIRRMFICDQERSLLPPWARFVRGVIDCPVLQPTASREGVHQDDSYQLLQRAIEDQLSRALRRIAGEQPVIWRQIVYAHTNVILNWAVDDQQFFSQVADIVPVESSRGRMSMPEYLKVSNGLIYYTRTPLHSLQEQVLAEGHDVPVIDASRQVMQQFLKRYAALFRLDMPVQLDGEAHALLRAVDAGPFSSLLEQYHRQGIKAEVVSFRPAELPAIMRIPREADFVREARSALAAQELPAPFAGMVSDYLGDLKLDEQDLQGTLCLNAACPIISRLAAAPAAAQAPALTLLHQSARLFAGRGLSATDAVRAFAALTGALEELLP
jgi:molecular chaperone HtpG